MPSEAAAWVFMSGESMTPGYFGRGRKLILPHRGGSRLLWLVSTDLLEMFELLSLLQRPDAQGLYRTGAWTWIVRRLFPKARDA